MQNKTFINLGLCVLFLFSGIQISHANGGGKVILGNWQNPMDLQMVDFQNEMTVTLFEDALLIVDLGARTADVPLNEYPDLYVEYDFGGQTGIYGPLLESEAEVKWVDDLNDFIKEIRVPHYFKYIDECENDVGRDDIFQMQVTYSLVTLVSGDYVPYPVSSHPGLFPESWFDENTTETKEKNIDCDGYIGGGGQSYGGTQEDQISDATLLAEGISPNPFKDDLNLVYELNKPSNVVINVFDMTGKLHYTKNQLRKDAGKHTEILDLENLTSGIYFLQLTNEGITRTIKMVKN